MILTVTLNPALDRSVTVGGFEFGGLVRVKDVYYTAGGKGINVAKVMKLFGADVGATGLSGGIFGDYIEKSLEEKGIKNYFVRISGETREDTTIIDAGSGKETHLIEPGPHVSMNEIERFSEKFLKIAEKSEFVVFSGSLPPGVSYDIYGQLISALNDMDVRCALDAKGPALKYGLKAKPFLVKPNREELEEVSGERLTSLDGIVHTARQIVKDGIKIIIASLGKDGMVFVDEAAVWRAVPPQVKALNSVGSGDALLGGFLFSYLSDGNVESAIELGMACGVANCIKPVAGAFTAGEAEGFRKGITISRL